MLINVAILLLAISMVFHGIFFSHRKRRAASSQAEASYWRLRWWGGAVGAYAIIVFFWAVINANTSHDAPHVIDFWPAVCMLWTDDGWFGAAGHSSAVEYESIFMGLVACVIAASARLWLVQPRGRPIYADPLNDLRLPDQFMRKLKP
jgi:hypothetical protein